MFPEPFRKHAVVPLTMYIGLYKKGDAVDREGMGTAKRGMLHKCYQNKSGTASIIIPCCWHHCQQASQGRDCCQEKYYVYLAQEAHQDLRWLPEQVKKTDKELRESKEKHPVHCLNQSSILCESKWEYPGLPKATPMGFMAWQLYQKKQKT